MADITAIEAALIIGYKAAILSSF